MFQKDLGKDPIQALISWHQEAHKILGEDADACALATQGPDVRIVLCKTMDPLRFYTSLDSVKAKQIRRNNHVALCFHWQDRQVRIRGLANQLSRKEAMTYFLERAKESQISALSSHQSQPVASFIELDEARERTTRHFDPSKAHWTGYEIEVNEIEFWQKGLYRFHDRVLFSRRPFLHSHKVSDNWYRGRLQP